MHADKNFSTICQRKETHVQQSKSSRVLPIPPKQYPMMTILSGSDRNEGVGFRPRPLQVGILQTGQEARTVVDQEKRS